MAAGTASPAGTAEADVTRKKLWLIVLWVVAFLGVAVWVTARGSGVFLASYVGTWLVGLWLMRRYDRRERDRR